MKKLIKLSIVMLMMVMAIGTTTNAAGSVSLNKKKISIIKGDTYKLRIKGTNKKVKWKSKNKKIATVNSNGKVTGKNKGKTTIVAKVGGKKYKCTVNVKNAKNLTETEATNKLIDWLEKKKKIKRGHGVMSFGLEGNEYIFKHYEDGVDFTFTINWYQVNRKTGKIKVRPLY